MRTGRRALPRDASSSAVDAHRHRRRVNALQTCCFLAVTALLATLIAATFARTQVGPHTTLHALFTDVSGLTKGSEVRAAGVEVGRVDKLQLQHGNDVLVTFSVADDVPVTTTTSAQVRYADLTGDRYLALNPGSTAGRTLPAGATMPLARTTPALDLDTLFNGFRPLTQALDPQQVNELTSSLIAVSQGEGSALQALLSHVASLTGTLADHDQLIDSVIDNLSTTLQTVDSHRSDLAHLIDGLSKLTGGLAKDRHLIGSSLASIDTLAAQSGQLLQEIRPDLKDDIAQANRMATAIDDNAAYADKYLSLMPDAINAVGRAGTYGSFFNFYLCGVRFKLSGLTGPVYTPFTLDKEKRCQF